MRHSTWVVVFPTSCLYTWSVHFNFDVPSLFALNVADSMPCALPRVYNRAKTTLPSLESKPALWHSSNTHVANRTPNLANPNVCFCLYKRAGKQLMFRVQIHRHTDFLTVPIVALLVFSFVVISLRRYFGFIKFDKRLLRYIIMEGWCCSRFSVCNVVFNLWGSIWCSESERLLSFCPLPLTCLFAQRVWR